MRLIFFQHKIKLWEMLLFQGRSVLELSEECFDFGPFVATIGDGDRSLLCHIWEWKIFLFQLFGLISAWKQVSCAWNFSQDATPFFWQFFGSFTAGKKFKATSDSWVPSCYHKIITSLHCFASSLETVSAQGWPHPTLHQWYVPSLAGKWHSPSGWSW